ncbi:MAG: ferrochelatase [Mycobacteriales bacterium]
MTASVGVVAMAYGTPRDRDDIARYYTDIRRGHPPTPEALAELVARYDAIGGTFPLRAITEAQCTELQRALDALDPGCYAVSLGQKHSAPTVEDAVGAVAAAGVGSVVGLVLAPHYSAYSVGQYAARLAAAAGDLPATTIESWHLLPEYLDFLAAAVRGAQQRLGVTAEVVFTAHSLPARIAQTGDAYPAQLAATAAAVASRVGCDRWSVAWQSAGRTPEPWLGPDIGTVINELAQQGVPGVVVCPCGFVADHLEVIYDLDIEAASIARDARIAFARTRSLNADATVVRALANVVAAAATAPAATARAPRRH